MLRFDPFSDLDALTRQLLSSAATGQTGTTRTPRFMPMDLYSASDHYVLHADLPGVDPGSIQIDVDNGTLSVRAERSSRPQQEVQWLASERFTGSYLRQVALGEGIDADGISATYDNGVLTLTIPVAEKAKPRRIEVTANRTSDDHVLSSSTG